MSQSLFRTEELRVSFHQFIVVSLLVVLSSGCRTKEHQTLTKVAIETDQGDIVVGVDSEHAPATSANFLKYVDAGFYTDGNFYRATRPDNYPTYLKRPPLTIIQGGINSLRTRSRFPPIVLERTSMTGLRHLAGTVSMARADPDTATSEFLICLTDQPTLDDGGVGVSDGYGLAAFGRVLTGLDVAWKILRLPTLGQSLKRPVIIRRIFRVSS